jgi:M6 family metalloprotease-like protein
MKSLTQLALAMGAMATFAPQGAEAQFPRARRGQFEVHGLDFRADGAWRGRVREVRARRHQFMRAGAVGALNVAAAPAASVQVQGSFFVPVVPIAYGNVPVPFPASEYQAVLFGSPVPSGRAYSLKTFYEQLSNGNIQVGGRVFDPVTLDSTDVFYEDGCNGVGVLSSCPNRAGEGGNRFGRMLLQVLEVVSNGPDATTAWAEFDNDGPDGLPNSGDDDGFVDFVTFLQPERDGACGTTNIWAHRFVISGWNGSPYVTKTPRAGYAGEFLKIEDYTIQSAVGGDNACAGAQIMPIGTVAHETGHAFGLPDLYDTDISSPTPTEGIGEWGLMGSGNYARPYSPSRFEAWSLVELGWVKVDTLAGSRTVRLGPVTSSDTVFYVPLPNSSEYLLLENRQGLESDSAQMNPAFGTHQKSPGLLIWHIDQAKVDQEGFSTTNTVNVGSIHGVALIQADGRNDLRVPGGNNRGDVGDAFPGSSTNRRLSAMSTPALADNLGRRVGFMIDSIYQIVPNGEMVFRFVRRANSLFASSGTAGAAGPKIRVNDVVTDRFEDIVPEGEDVQLSADSVQTLADGISRATFTGWSNGQPRTHTLRSDAVPDTVTASFSITTELTVAAADAATDLLGTPTLTAAQRQALDARGNKNGVYDLGDFLAYVSGSAQAVSPELMAQVMKKEDR